MDTSGERSDSAQPTRGGGARAILSAFVLVAISSACGAHVTTPKALIKAPGGFSQKGEGARHERPWLAFSDPELDRLVKMALSDNPDLSAAAARLAQARALADKVGAGLMPQLNGEAGASATTAKAGNSASLSVGLAASYEIDLWGRVRSTRDAATLDLLASQEALHALEISLSAEIASAWFQLIEAQGQLALLERLMELNKKVLSVVSFKFGQGLATAADVLQQRQLLESLRGNSVQVLGQAQILRHQLALLVGKAPGQITLAARSTLPALPALPEAGLPAALLERRPDVRQAFYNVRAADARVATAISDRYPRLSISASASLTGGLNPASFSNWIANLAANLLAPLIDGGSRRAEVARTKAVVAETLASYKKVALGALGEVENALVQEKQQLGYLNSLHKQLALSSSVVDQLRQRYGNGYVDYLRVLDALVKHQTLARSQLTVRRDVFLTRVTLYRALAGGWETKTER